MIGILAIVFFILWYKFNGGKQELENEVRKAHARATTTEGSREDYIRGYQNEDRRYDRM